MLKLESRENLFSEWSEIICTVCPLGCKMRVNKKGDFVEVKGGCSRGKDYAKQEIRDPRRVVATTVAVRQGALKRVPVRTSCPFPKKKIFQLMQVIDRLEVEAPLRSGEVILQDVAGEKGINLLATRTVNRRSRLEKGNN